MRVMRVLLENSRSATSEMSSNGGGLHTEPGREITRRLFRDLNDRNFRFYLFYAFLVLDFLILIETVRNPSATAGRCSISTAFPGPLYVATDFGDLQHTAHKTLRILLKGSLGC
jgi:hypothetical protein